MSPGISLELHWWRGIGPTVQRDLFFYGFRFGFLTLSICRVCVIDSYKILREAIDSRVKADQRRLDEGEK
jgi:hypothetical protein